MNVAPIVKLALSAPSHTSFQCGAYSREILPLASFVTAWGPNHSQVRELIMTYVCGNSMNLGGANESVRSETSA